MTPDERQMLAGLFDRLREAEANPRDREAEAFIAERAREAPHAAYALAQAVLVQDQALAAADQRIRELEGRLREMESRPEPQPESFLGGIGKSLFGSRERDAEPPRAGAPDPWRRAEPARGYDAPAEGMAPRGLPPTGGWQGQPAAQGGPWAPARAGMGRWTIPGAGRASRPTPTTPTSRATERRTRAGTMATAASTAATAASTSDRAPRENAKSRPLGSGGGFLLSARAASRPLRDVNRQITTTVAPTGTRP